ncbi:hypothetical protein CXG81DRAFT_3774, partial [Caulochytrium protostelioides]
AWDCGIAVVSMVLLALGKIDTPLFALAESPDQSVWTIDLATILQRFQVPDFTFFTSYIGINWQYTNDAFYNDALGDDRERVHRLFASAADAGIRVIPMALEASDLRRFLMSGQYAAIVLTDLRYLQCIACARGTGFMARRLFPLVQGWRAGHYILLTDFLPDKGQFIYRDPGSDASLCYVTERVLERARGSVGTDNDVIVVRI